MDRWRSRFDLALAALFVLLVLAPGVCWLTGFQGFLTLSEKREPAPLPGLPEHLADASTLPKKFEAAFNDRFGLRNDGIVLNNLIDYTLLGRSPLASVVRGTQGWLYLQTSVDYRRMAPFPAPQLARSLNYVAGMQRWLASRGIAYFLTVAPNKSTIHPEHLPTSALPPPGASRYDQLLSALTRASLPIIDLKAPLRAAAASGPVYSRTDTHWNGDGRYAGYQTLIAALHTRGFGTPPRPDSDFARTEEPRPGYDLAAMIGLQDRLADTIIHHAPIVSNVTYTRLPDYLGRHWRIGAPLIASCPTGHGRLLIVGDSFLMDGEVPCLLAAHFAVVLVVHRDYLPVGLGTLIPVIEDFRPDVVLEETVERNLSTPLPLEPDFDRQAKLDRRYRELDGRPLALAGANLSRLAVAQGPAPRVTPAGLALRADGPGLRLSLPRLDPAPRRPAVLRLDLTAPTRTPLRLLDGARPVDTATLRMGRNVVYLALPDSGPNAPLSLTLAGTPGEYVLHGLALRDASRRAETAQPGLPLLLGSPTP